MLLYIHIPFCDSKCFYCAFNSYTDKSNLKKNYLESLKVQLKSELQKHKPKIETVFLGGGTPSTIKHENYKEIFEIIKPYLEKDVEITSEANPNSATKEWLEGMFSYGVKRISFGVQSFDDKKLKFLGRAHNSKTAIEAINNASNIGFNSINCDIIYGVKDDTFETIKKDLEIAFSLPVTHLSAYSLTIEEGTKFFLMEEKSKNRSGLKIDDEDLSYEIFDFIEKNGFTQYEISNFARGKNFESKHNYGYWEYKNYLGIGCGAVGCVDGIRYYPNKNLEEYISNPLQYETEELSEDDIKTEKVLLGLRCSTGVDLTIFNKKELEKISDLKEHNKVFEENNRIFNKNFLLADELALYILG